MCWILTAVIVGYSWIEFPRLRDYEQRLQKSFASEGLRPAMDLWSDLCRDRLKDEEQCRAAGLGILKSLGREAELDDETLKAERERLGEVKGEESSLAAIKSLQALRKLREEFGGLLQDPLSAKDPKVLGLPSYAGFVEYFKKSESLQTSLAKKFNFLSQATVGVATLLKAQFTHGDFLHMLSNLIVLLIFGRYVEARMGAGWMIATFMVSGVVGLWGQLQMYTSEASILLGASAGVSGIIGAFLVFFFRHPMQVWLSVILVFNRRIYMPSYWIVGVVFVAKDVIGALSSDGNVAHGAHLIGLFVGAGMAFLHRRLHPLPDKFLYPDEQFYTGRLQSTSNAMLKKSLGERIVSWNPNNMTALESLVRGAGEKDPLGSWLTSLLAVGGKQRDLKPGVDVLRDLPLSARLPALVPRLSVKNHLAYARAALERDEWLPALRLYDSVLHKSLREGTRANVRKSVEQICTALRQRGETLTQLKEMPLHADLKTIV